MNYRWLLILPACTLLVFEAACSSQATAPVINKIDATYQNVYPFGSTEIHCEASDPSGDTLIFRWSATGGSFIGTGPIVTWNAPPNYGDYHIMVSVKNTKGDVTQQTLTVSVVQEQGQQQGCSSCGR